MKTLCCAALLICVAQAGCKNNLLPAGSGPSLTGDTPPPATAVPQDAPQVPAGAQQAQPTGARVEGTLDVAPEMANHIKPGDTIFLIARHAETNMMVAVSKLSAPARFPMAFGLGSENIMNQGVPFSGPLKIMARVDKDGDATSKTPGDVVGEVEGNVAVPASGVVLKLSRLL